MEVSRVDISRLRKRLGAANAARANAASAAMAVMVQTLGENLAVNSPRDTNRYVRAWIQAATQAGAKGLPEFPLRPSRFRSDQERALRRQVDFWKQKLEKQRRWIEGWWHSQDRDPSKDKLGRKAVRDFERYQRLYEQAERELREFLSARDPVIVIGRDNVRGKDPEKGGRRLITIRRQVYGGSGAVVIRRDRVEAVLVNKEPHARIVEAKTQTFARSFAVVKVFGVRRAGAEFVKRVKVAWGGGAVRPASEAPF